MSRWRVLPMAFLPSLEHLCTLINPCGVDVREHGFGRQIDLVSFLDRRWQFANRCLMISALT